MTSIVNAPELNSYKTMMNFARPVSNRTNESLLINDLDNTVINEIDDRETFYDGFGGNIMAVMARDLPREAFEV